MKAKSKKPTVLIGVAVAAVIFIAIAVASRDGGSGKSDTDALYAEVRQGPLVINIEEYGEIIPSEQIVLKNEVQGRSQIISLVAEGTIAKKGDLLVQLDVSAKIDEKDSQEIILQNAESNLEVAREALEIQKNQSESDVEIAEQDYIFAQEDLEKYEQGDYPTKLIDQKGQLALKEQQVKQAKDKYEWSKKLYAENFISETELEGDELSWKSSQLSLESAQRELELLETYTHRRELAKYKSDVKQRGMAFERAKKKAASAIAQAESNLRAKESEFRKQQQRYEKILDQIAKAEIRAPRDGQVVFANTRGGREPLQEGQEVWERQELIRLPTADTFSARISIHEASLKNVTTGMPVRVRCDAIPGKVFGGVIEKIAPMPDGERRWMNPDLKEYPSEILITEGSDELKHGMGCKAEIIIDQYESAIYIPVQCVVRIAGGTFVWKRTSAGDVKTAVEVGMDNNRFIRIISGLEPGEEVMLSPPLHESATTAENEIVNTNSTVSAEAETKPAEARE